MDTSPTVNTVATPSPSSRRQQSPHTPDHVDLRRVLQQFGIRLDAAPLPPQVGPSIVRHRIALCPGERIESVRRCQEDISRSLGREVAIAHLPGEPFIAIDIPRDEREVVHLVAALKELPATNNNAELLMPFGVTPEGTPVWLDLGMLPHVLAAGTTNSGKSIFLQCTSITLALRFGPEALELLIIDVKSVDFGAFAGLPHLREGQVISEPEHIG